MVEWKPFGDENPLDHGGIWIKEDSDIEGCFYIVELVKDYSVDKWHVIDSYVDITDSWINYTAVEGYIGELGEGYDKAISVYSYYGYGELQGNRKEYDFSDERLVLQELNDWGIQI